MIARASRTWSDTARPCPRRLSHARIGGECELSSHACACVKAQAAEAVNPSGALGLFSRQGATVRWGNIVGCWSPSATRWMQCKG